MRGGSSYDRLRLRRVRCVENLKRCVVSLNSYGLYAQP